MPQTTELDPCCVPLWHQNARPSGASPLSTARKYSPTATNSESLGEAAESWIHSADMCLYVDDVFIVFQRRDPR